MSPDHAGAGFPPGTASAPGRLEDALARLEAVCGGTAPTPTLVMNAGIASAENILWLGERGYDWIALGRGGGEVLDHQRASRGARLSVVSEDKKKAGTSILDLTRTRFEAALERLRSGLPVKGRLKRYDRVLDRTPQAALPCGHQALRDHARDGGHRRQPVCRARQAQAAIRRGR